VPADFRVDRDRERDQRERDLRALPHARTIAVRGLAAGAPARAPISGGAARTRSGRRAAAARCRAPAPQSG
jgi:hypothetical protein